MVALALVRTGAAGVTGAVAATPFIAWKKAARAEAAVLAGAAAGRAEGELGRIGVIGSAFGKQG
jgi:hypothetical protein